MSFVGIVHIAFIKKLFFEQLPNMSFFGATQSSLPHFSVAVAIVCRICIDQKTKTKQQVHIGSQVDWQLWF